MHHGPSPAAAVAAALALQAEEVCRRYLPQGRRLGRYWICGDLDGARGRSLFVRLSGSGKPGKWTDAATGEHGDLLDLIRYRTNAPTLRAALDEARAFLALPAARATASDAPYDATEAARRLWRRCRAIDGSHAERYLQARGLSRCRFAALRYHPELRYREGASVRHLPALVAAVTGDAPVIGNPGQAAACLACSAPGSIRARPPRRASPSPRKALGRIHGLAVRFGVPAADAPLVVGEGIETVLSLVTAVPEIAAAAALSAGSLGAFAPPPGVARLVDRAGQRRGRRARGRAPCHALRAARCRRRRHRSPGQRLQRRPRRLRRGGAARPLRRRCSARLPAPPGSQAAWPGSPVRWRKRGARGRASRPEGRRESMSAVINLKHEPELRAAFEHAHVHGQHRADRPPHEVG